jgi:hypothetical protein
MKGAQIMNVDAELLSEIVKVTFEFEGISREEVLCYADLRRRRKKARKYTDPLLQPFGVKVCVGTDPGGEAVMGYRSRLSDRIVVSRS